MFKIAERDIPMRLRDICEFLNLNIIEKELIPNDILEKNIDELNNFRIYNFLCLCNDDKQKDSMTKYFRMILPNISYIFSCYIDDIIYFMDSLELKERNIILIPLTEFSGNIFEKIMGYKSTIKYIFLYRNYKFDRIISSEKFPIILLNNIDSLIDTLKDDYKLSKNLYFNYDDILEEKNYYLGLKENMSYKINLNNFTQKYLEYRDHTKIYTSLQNLTILTL